MILKNEPIDVAIDKEEKNERRRKGREKTEFMFGLY
jgi:hypothetical protein